MIQTNVVLPEIACDPSHEYAYKDRYTDRHKPHGQGNPRSLEHSGENVAAQIVSSHNIHSEGRNLIGQQRIEIGPGKRRPQLFLEPDQGGIKNRVLT